LPSSYKKQTDLLVDVVAKLKLTDCFGFLLVVIADCPIGTVHSCFYMGQRQLKAKLFNYAKENRYILKGSQG
jgi:hypothetical protein